MTGRTIAAGVAGAALAVGGVLLAQNPPDAPDYLVATTTQTSTAFEVPPPAPPPACTAVDGVGGVVVNACAVQVTKWQQEARNAGRLLAYQHLWARQNPGEWSRLRAWAVSDRSTPQPSVSTSYGSLIRYGVGQCRSWAIDLSTCAL